MEYDRKRGREVTKGGRKMIDRTDCVNYEDCDERFECSPSDCPHFRSEYALDGVTDEDRADTEWEMEREEMRERRREEKNRG